MSAQAKSVTAQAFSPSTQAKAVAALAWRLKRKQEKNILSLSMGVGRPKIFLG
jgi:hypothetical protein